MKSRILISLLVFTVLLLVMALNVFAEPDLPQASVYDYGAKFDRDVYDTGDLSEPVPRRVDFIPETWQLMPEGGPGDYKDWYFDFRVTFSEPFEAGSFGLYCEIGLGGREIAFVYPEDTGDGPVYLLRTAGISVTYGDLFETAQLSNFGVFNLSEENCGRSVTAEFVITNPEDSTESYVLAGVEYTFEYISILDGPWTVTLTSADTDGNEGIATLTGGGTYPHGEWAVLTAPETDGYDFVGWYSGSYPSGELISPLPSFELRVDSDLDLLAVYDSSGWGVLHVTGSSYTVNGGDEQSGDGDFNLVTGSRATVRYTGEDFLYWVNSSGNIVSTNRKYTFTFVGDTTLRLITSRNEETEDSVYVIFRNAYDQVLSAGRVTDPADAEALFPKYNPGKMGLDFYRWVFEGTEDEATAESIAGKIGPDAAVVTVVPAYRDLPYSYTVTVMAKTGDEDPREVFRYLAGTSEPYTVFLSELCPMIGLPYDPLYVCWTLDGETPVSYDTEQFTVIGSEGQEITVTAVFLPEEEYDPRPAVAVTGLTASGTFHENVYRCRLSVTLSFYLPEGYALHRSGFVRSTSGEEFDGENLVIGAEGTKVHETSFTGRSGIYTMNLNTSDPDKLFCFRAFITYTDPDGNLVTLYSPMVSGSFFSVLFP